MPPDSVPTSQQASAKALKRQIPHTLLVPQSDRRSPRKYCLCFSRSDRHCETDLLFPFLRMPLLSLGLRQDACHFCFLKGIHFICFGVNFLSALSHSASFISYVLVEMSARVLWPTAVWSDDSLGRHFILSSTLTLILRIVFSVSCIRSSVSWISGDLKFGHSLLFWGFEFGRPALIQCI